MWESKVKSIYESTYEEQIPTNWFDFAKGCDYFLLPCPNIKIINNATVRNNIEIILCSMYLLEILRVLL
jgi:hypothetical protein